MYGKIMFTVLFASALYTTFTEVTNVTVTDMMEKYGAGEVMEQVETKTIFDNFLEKISVFDVEMEIEAEQTTYLSSEMIVTDDSLEEVLDLEQLPSRKVVATGYTAGVESTGKTEDHPEYGITYSGVPVKRDLFSTIAADLDVFPLGTVLYIPGYGLGVVADIGGAIKGERIDLYFESVEEVFAEWGKKEVAVYDLEEGNGTITEGEIDAWNDGDVLQVLKWTEALKADS